MEYRYKCDKCNKDYTETRSVDEAQFFTVCDACGGTYVETAE
jgi:predicted SprT family Zn-dependent metalloprotease